MTSQQTAMPLSPVWHPLRSASALCRHAIDTLRARRDGGPERVASGLSLHLRYDVGVVDCRPPPQPAEVLKPQQTTLESTWLRSVR